jgi:hypothetical protein
MTNTQRRTTEELAEDNEQKIDIVLHFLRSDTATTWQLFKLGIIGVSCRLTELRRYGFPISKPEDYSYHGKKKFKIYEVTDRELFAKKAEAFFKSRNFVMPLTKSRKYVAP